MPINIQQHLEEDISTLHELLIREDPLPPRHVRAVAAPIIRKWLFENHLNILARDIECEITLPSYDSSKIFENIGEDINIFITGGIYLGGEFIRSIYFSSQDWEGEPLIQNIETDIKFYKPSKLLKQNKIFYKNQSFNVEKIIKFYCNKDGGVHLDFKRHEKWQESLAEAAEYFILGNPYKTNEIEIIDLDDDKNGRKLLVLPKEKNHIWNALDVEILGLAQSLINIHCNGVRVLQTT